MPALKFTVPVSVKTAAERLRDDPDYALRILVRIAKEARRRDMHTGHWNDWNRLVDPNIRD